MYVYVRVGVVDSAPYFFNHIKRIGSLGYIPNEEDLLLVRTKTTGVTLFFLFVFFWELRICAIFGGTKRKQKTKKIKIIKKKNKMKSVIKKRYNSYRIYNERRKESFLCVRRGWTEK